MNGKILLILSISLMGSTWRLLSNSSIHSVIHQVLVLIQVTSTDIVLAGITMTCSRASTIFTPVVAILSTIAYGTCISLVWYNSASNNSKCTWVFTLSWLLLNERGDSLAIVLVTWVLDRTCTELWHIIMVQLCLSFLDLVVVSSSIMGQSASKLTTILILLHILLMRICSFLTLILAILLVHDFNVLIILITNIFLPCLWKRGILSLPSSIIVLLLLTGSSTCVVESIGRTKSGWLVHEAHLILNINWVHLLVDIWRSLVIVDSMS